MLKGKEIDCPTCNGNKVLREGKHLVCPKCNGLGTITLRVMNRRELMYQTAKRRELEGVA